MRIVAQIRSDSIDRRSPKAELSTAARKYQP